MKDVRADDQRRAPLLDTLRAYCEKQLVPLHVPAHRAGCGAPKSFVKLAGKQLFNIDLTEVLGLDDLHNPSGVIAQAQQLAASAYGAEQSFFIVNGSTCGLQALLVALCRPGEPVILPRNMHRSVLGGLIFSGADPVYIQPRIIPDFGVAAGVSPAQVRRALEKYPETRGVVIVNPTYYGVTCNVKLLADAAHAYGKPLLVDEAHGAHLRFHPDLPPDALSAGADAVVQSMHKLGGALTQASMLHLKGARVNGKRVAAALATLQTTSPSYILMASLDAARQQMSTNGRVLLDKALELAFATRRRLQAIPGLKVLNNVKAWTLDPTKIVVSAMDLGITGYELREVLYKRYRIQVELADYKNILCLITIGTTEKDCNELVRALENVVLRLRRGEWDNSRAAFLKTCNGHRQTRLEFLNGQLPLAPVKRMTPRQAWFAKSVVVPLQKAAGEISAETVAVYPPGIPVLCPGEEITPEIVDYLKTIGEQCLPVQGPQDPSLKTLRVVYQ